MIYQQFENQKQLLNNKFFFTICVLIGCSSFCLGDDYIHLFNGKDLTGWKETFDIESFKVENGILKANSTSRRMPHLLYVGEDGNTKFKNQESII